VTKPVPVIATISKPLKIIDEKLRSKVRSWVDQDFAGPPKVNVRGCAGQAAQISGG